LVLLQEFTTMHGHLNFKLFGYISADETITQNLDFAEPVKNSADKAAKKNKATFHLRTSKLVCCNASHLLFR